MSRPKVKSVGSNIKRWKELQSRRSFRSVYHVRVCKQHNGNSFMQDPPTTRQNAKETISKVFNNMNAEDKNVVFSTTLNDNLVNNRDLIEENRKEIQEVTPVDHYQHNEEYKMHESFAILGEKQKQRNQGNKTVHWIDDDEESLMDLGISEVERTKRLESLMERRRSRTLSKFQIIRNAMGVGVGNNSCGQISSLNIPKKNPFLSKSSGDLNSPVPGSAPTYMVKSNPFDLPYDPHEEKPILTGDEFEEEFMATHKRDPIFFRRECSSSGNLVALESTNDDTQDTSFDTEFAIKQLRRLGTSKIAKKEDDNKNPQEKCPGPHNGTDDKPTIEDGEASKKAVDIPEEKSEEKQEVHHDVVVSSDQSTSSSSSSEDEPILRPNKEAILHCLSMSRMRIVSQGNNFHRNAESFDCGPSALFDKSKTDGFFFGANKRIHYGTTNSVASDMQVEVSEIGSPPSTNISSLDEECKGSLVNSTNPSEMDLNEVRLRDIDEMSEQSTLKPYKIDEQDAPYFNQEDTRMTHDHKDSCAELEIESSTDQGLSSSFVNKVVNEVQEPDDREIVVESLDELIPDGLPLSNQE